MWKKFFSFLKKLFKGSNKTSVDDKPVHMPAPTIPVGVGTKVNKESVGAAIVLCFNKYEGAKEINGGNTDHGGRIDYIIKSEGGSPGQQYCAYTFCRVIDDVLIHFGIKSWPVGVPKSPWVPDYPKKTFKKYILSSPYLGCAFIAFNSHHIGFCEGNIMANGMVKTMEGNDDNEVKRDLRDHKLALCYIDIVQAIIDQYEKENSK